jgi:FkbM family methyltransferase
VNPITTVRLPEHGAEYRMWYSPCKIGRAAAASGNLYERPFLDWIAEQHFSGSALDIGANILNHGLWMHFVCGLNVVAFEPVIPHVARANAALNGVLGKGIDVRDYALGATPGVGYHVAKGEIKSGTSKQSTDETFDIRRLDDEYLPNNVAFVKVDVEGYEASVLRGGEVFLAAQRPVLAVESWTPQTDKDIAYVLTPLGYAKSKVFGGRGKAPMQIWEPM